MAEQIRETNSGGPASGNSAGHQVKTAPIPVPVLRYKGGQPILPGQGGLNPCICFAFLFNGTCTLRFGCIIISVIHIVYGGIELLESTANLILPEISAKIAESQGRSEYRQSSYVQSYNKDLEDFLAVESLLEGTVIHLVAGVVLLVGALTLNKVLALVYTVTIAISFLFYIVVAITLSVLIGRVDTVDGLNASDVRVLRVNSQIYLWSTTLGAAAILLYFLVCGFAFYRQVAYGEYDMKKSSVMAPKGKIRGSIDSQGKASLKAPPIQQEVAPSTAS